jgi:hypothetical protein
MTTTGAARTLRLSPGGCNDRLHKLLALHFHPEHGSRYW